MAAENARVDTTYIGYFLIGFTLLLLGVMGLQNGNVFGEYTTQNYSNMPLDMLVVAKVLGIVGLILILLTVFAYRTGKQTSAGIFAFFGASMVFYYLDNYIDTYEKYIASNSDWFLYLALAIFFLVFVIGALMAKAPKFVTVLLLLITLMFFFTVLAAYYLGPGSDRDIFRAVSIVYGIFAFLGFIVATYLGLAYANPKKVPLI